MDELTQYLLRYKKLAIPHVGSFELVEQSPEFNMADKLMLPPAYRLHWQEADAPAPHQLSWINQHAPAGEANDLLQQRGRALADALQQAPFQWKGIGVLRKIGSQVVVEESNLALPGFEPVPAHRVIREGAVHAMLVGDRETNTEVMTNELAPQAEKRSVVMLLGWLLLLVLLLAALYFLYRNNWQLSGTGLQRPLFSFVRPLLRL